MNKRPIRFHFAGPVFYTLKLSQGFMRGTSAIMVEKRHSIQEKWAFVMGLKVRANLKRLIGYRPDNAIKEKTSITNSPFLTQSH
jgi:hypothetical protein